MDQQHNTVIVLTAIIPRAKQHFFLSKVRLVSVYCSFKQTLLALSAARVVCPHQAFRSA